MKTKLHFQRFFATLLLLAVSTSSWAYSIEVDGIYYDININILRATVISRDNNNDSYSGSVVIPYSVNHGGETYRVTSIGNSAFFNCSGLTSITIPNSVTSIGVDAFAYCSGLTSITIPNSVTSIGDDAFFDCSGLTAITIPENVTSIGYRAFANCSGLTSISVSQANTTYDSRNNCNAIIETATNTLVAGCKKTFIPNSVTSIGSYAFQGCSGRTSITIPNSVTSIGSCAFLSCSGLTSVTIGNNVTSIGYGAFSFCTGLTSIYIPNSVTSIGNSAFFRCRGLTSINIPNSVTSIGGDTFSGCTSLTSVTIGNSVTSIGNNAFKNCTSLTSVTCLAESVPTTETDVFSGVPLSSATLYIPTSALDVYNTAEPWNDFGTILLIGYLYIETDITDQFPVDWQGWDGATGYVGWAAPQVTTNDGRTTPACEKFNGSSAEQGTVFTRTLTGLVNGTYRIELYGAAASTKGRDTNIDSNMTASDEGDETAVYLYAKTASGTVKQYIPVHWATSFSEIATAVLNKVIVTDGTVELGMVSNKKFTNWHVVQIKGVTALVDAIELHEKALSEAQKAINDVAYVNVIGSERTALSLAIAAYSVVNKQTVETYKKVINALETATKTFTDAKTSYDALAVAKTLVDGLSYPYATEAKKAAAEDAAAAAVATSAADASSKTDALLTAYRQYAESSAILEGVEGATNMTSYIKNPKAEQAINASVWQTVLGEGSGGNISIWTNEPWTDGNGSTNHKYFDGGNWDDTSWDVAFKQNVTLPAGRYQLTAIGRSSGDVTLTLFAGEETAEMAHIGNTGGLFNRGWEQTSVEFELTTGATVGIGVRGVTPAYHNWMSFSDFRLVQFPGGDTGVDSMQANDKDAEDDDSIYDLNGRKLSKKPENGYYIQGGKIYLAK